MSFKIDLDCAECGRSFKTESGRAQKGSSVKCLHSNTTYRFSDSYLKNMVDNLKK
jgi:hypothetical protein